MRYNHQSKKCTIIKQRLRGQLIKGENDLVTHSKIELEKMSNQQLIKKVISYYTARTILRNLYLDKNAENLYLYRRISMLENRLASIRGHRSFSHGLKSYRFKTKNKKSK